VNTIFGTCAEDGLIFLGSEGLANKSILIEKASATIYNAPGLLNECPDRQTGIGPVVKVGKLSR
jgi:hypothetical protein